MKVKDICKATTPSFGVSTTILNIKYLISRKWCKLNFGPLRDQVKSYHFPKRIDAGSQYLYKYLAIIDRKRLGQPFWIMIWIYYYLLKGIRLDLDLDKSCWIRKIPNLATNNINILVFHITTTHSLTQEIELAELDYITNCLTDNLSKFLYFSNSISAW